MSQLTDQDLIHLQTCLKLAEEAVDAGDQPFGSILVTEDNEVVASARNRINEIHILAHPEFELADWALRNLSVTQRKRATMYTTGEHCPMCAAAHGWAGIGGLVYLSSAKQLSKWLFEMNQPEAPIKFYPVEKIIKNVEVRGPAGEDMIEKIKNLHKRYYFERQKS